MAYSVRPIPMSSYGKHEMLVVVAGLADNASAATRQRTIEMLIFLHGISRANTRSITYDPTFLAREGRNVKGDIRIGPEAFKKKDHRWLANVIFHESIHSDQFVWYDAKGFKFGSGNPTSTERILIALDEFEGFYWPWKNSAALDLSEDHQRELRREVDMWLIEIDHPPTQDLAKKADFEQARLNLIGGGKKATP